MNIAVFASGNGTNFQAMIDRAEDGYIPAKVVLLVCDNKDAYAIERARKAGIEVYIQEPGGFGSREAYDRAVIEKLREKEVDLVVLAGFMRLMSKHFCREYKERVLNIHPALLPAFKGTHGVKDALEYGVKVTGPTVHFVDEKLDHGPIILQDTVPVSDDDTVDTLHKKVHEKEYGIYPKAVKLFVEGRLDIEGRKVRIKDDQDQRR
jgi:phosphoribosylglycinamide formyltransferase-1